jgi:fumarate reductase flavoprotein subunit
MSENLQFDVIVIGGGIAGLVAANQAVDRNLKTLVLEKGESTNYPCNTRFAGGTYHACLRDVMTEPKVLAKLMVESSRGFISPLHAQVIALNAF